MRLILGSSRSNRGLRRGGALTGNDPGALAASAAIFSGGRSELRFFPAMRLLKSLENTYSFGSGGFACASIHRFFKSWQKRGTSSPHGGDLESGIAAAARQNLGPHCLQLDEQLLPGIFLL